MTLLSVLALVDFVIAYLECQVFDSYEIVEIRLLKTSLNTSDEISYLFNHSDRLVLAVLFSRLYSSF